MQSLSVREKRIRMARRRWYFSLALFVTLALVLCGVITAVVAAVRKKPEASGASAPVVISQQGLALLKQLEGFAPFSYRGVDSRNRTIGYGHVVQPGENFDSGMSEDEAAMLLVKDLRAYHARLRDFTGEHDLILAQNQFDALVIFSYQLGPKIWLIEEYDFIQLLKTGVWTDDQIVYEMGRFDMSESVAYEGLWKRRMNEALLFVTGDYRFYEAAALEELGYVWPKKGVMSASGKGLFPRIRSVLG